MTPRVAITGLPSRTLERTLALEALPAALRLLRLLSRDVPPDEVFLPLALLQVQGVALGLLFHSRELLPGELGVVPGVLLEPAVLDLGDRRADPVQEGPVVGDQHEGLARAGEEVLEPFGRRHVEVVRGLIQKEKVGPGKDEPGDRDASLLAAAQRPERLRPERPADTQTLENLLHAVVDRVAAHPREVIVEVSQLVGKRGQLFRGRVAAFQKLRANRLLALHQLEQLAKGSARVLKRGFLAVGLDLLVEHRHANPGRDRAGATLRLDRARQNSEQGRLAGAVSADEADTCVVADPEGEVLEQRAGAESVCDPVEADQDHPEGFLRFGPSGGFSLPVSRRFCFSAFSSLSRSTNSAS